MKTSFDEMDSPEEIVEASIKEQRRILTGYKGSYRTNMSKYEEAVNPKHAAISLIGEPTLYPYLEDLIEVYGKRGLTTFVVSNGTNPEVIEEINPTQLYISLESFEEEMYKKMCRPNEKDLWERVLESLEILGKKRCRTVLRITLVRGLNFEAERFIPLIELASPDYIEVKSYMHLGYSRYRLERDRMPTHREIKEFSRILDGKTDYSILDDAEISRVVLLSKDKGEDRMIDF
jgi:tRNA wybutosine-synthesizing protein 1